MFDYVRSSYNLGSQFTDIELHTKDIEEGIGGTMTQYWIAPDGCIYYINYSHTADFVVYDEGDPKYNSERPWANFEWIPNGIHGKVSPWLLTKYIEVYPSRWDGDWKDWPRLRLHFRNGKLQDYVEIKRNETF
jgi:hypothetical protein